MSSRTRALARNAKYAALDAAASAGVDWAHRPALGTTCRTAEDGTVTADACGTCGRPLRLDPNDPNPATQWHLSKES